ncbi:ferredoxin [Streptomyces sp. NRRL F-5126]|uniref:ferredoxin n=1 Tax=Streptomyces sp. NRRL F-5126 TaxID=1463857 RepID=UPI000AD1BC20|nr:ferredoxin [Streptomyces sp. NRRL F-5126]
MTGTSWHIAVDQGQCIGSGMCVALLPKRFVLPGDAARVLPGAADGAPDEALLDAADSCPVLAITVTDRATGRLVGPRP